MRGRTLASLLGGFLLMGAVHAVPASGSHSSTDPAFDARQTYPLQAAPGGAAIGDVSGDGLPDVVVGTTYSGSDSHDFLVKVYLQRVDGTLDQPLLGASQCRRRQPRQLRRHRRSGRRWWRTM